MFLTAWITFFVKKISIDMISSNGSPYASFSRRRGLRRNLQKRTISLVAIGDSYELLRELYLKLWTQPKNDAWSWWCRSFLNLFFYPSVHVANFRAFRATGRVSKRPRFRTVSGCRCDVDCTKTFTSSFRLFRSRSRPDGPVRIGDDVSRI